jgi:4-hydroxy 2-oxovalerate aldolase
MTSAIHHSRLFTDTHSVLDATLRDAGYMNDWQFSRDEIFQVVGAVAQAGAEGVEVGYISDTPDRPLAARCDADLLQALRAQLGGASNLVVMLSLSETDPARLLSSRVGLIDLVRIPCTFAELPQALKTAELTHQHGIACSVNLVNISTLTREDFLHVAHAIKHSGVVDIFYLADSRGACHPDEVVTMIRTVREVWDGRFGFHAHDNTGFAAVNALRALDAGCEVIDGTVNGLGLGSGNTKLSHALSMVQARCPGKHYQIAALDAVCRRLRVPMPAEKSYLYYLVGAKNLAQLWVEPLLARYGSDTERLLQEIPRRAYTDIKQVFAEIDHEPA